MLKSNRGAWWAVACALMTMTIGVPAATAAGTPSSQRGIELVSPVDKNGGDIVGDGQTVFASADGNGIAFSSRASFADTAGTGALGQIQYIARRGASGWSTHAITPTPALQSFQVFFGSTLIPTFSDNLDRAILWAYDLPGAADDVPDGVNIYREETATRALQTLTRSNADPISPFDFLVGAAWGTSSDDDHVALVSPTRLLPEAPAGVPSVYEWVNGSLRLAGVLPDGSVPPDGSDIQPQYYRDTVSPDGSRVAFISPPSGDSQLYLRVNGSSTAWVSQSEGSTPVPTPSEVQLQDVSPDGRHVLFTTSSPLTDADTNSSSDLYMYTDSAHPANDSNLTLISAGGGVVGLQDGTAVVGMSDDGQRVYFQEASGNRLMLWDHGTLRVVSPGVLRSYTGATGGRLSATDADPGAARVSADGAQVAFLTSSTQGNDGIHALTGQVSNGHVEMYVYDAVRDNLTCVACPPDGRAATADATVSAGATGGTATLVLPGLRPRFLSQDGRRVFVSTEEALMDTDTNGLADVYEYDTDTHTLALVSTGQGDDDTWFSDASMSGDDVFLITRQRLAAADRDSLADLYDARVGGGFPAPAAAPRACADDECQGPLGATPESSSPGSATFQEGSAVHSRAAQTARMTILGARSGGMHRSAVVRVKISGRGRITWSGRGVRRGSRRISKAGSYDLRVSLSPAMRRRLRSRRGLSTTVSVRFAPIKGMGSAAIVSLSFAR